MAATYVSSAATLNKLDTDSPIAVDPTSMGLSNGDTVLAIVTLQSTGTPTLSVSQGGGQTWTSGTNNTSGTSGAFRLFWCTFNGTWSANPSFASSTTSGFVDFTAVLVGFRPTSSGTPLAVDATGSESSTAYAAPGTPFDVTTTGQTPTKTSGVFIGVWTNYLGTPTWSLQTGGWTNPGGTTQWTNTNTGATISVGYKIFTSAGASGNVTNRQNATGYAGWKSIITFSETVSTPASLLLLMANA